MNVTTTQPEDFIAPGMLTILICGSITSFCMILTCISMCLKSPDCIQSFRATRKLTHFLAWPGTTVVAVVVNLKHSNDTADMETSSLQA